MKSTSIVLCIDIPSGDEHEEDDLDDNDAELLGELGKKLNQELEYKVITKNVYI